MWQSRGWVFQHEIHWRVQENSQGQTHCTRYLHGLCSTSSFRCKYLGSPLCTFVVSTGYSRQPVFPGCLFNAALYRIDKRRGGVRPAIAEIFGQIHLFPIGRLFLHLRVALV